VKQRKFENPVVKARFGTYPAKIRDKLLPIRELIFRIAAESDEIGAIEETLKWGNPSYLTVAPKSGTTIRLSTVNANDLTYAISVHCQTSLMSEFKAIYPQFEYDGNRSIIFSAENEISIAVIEHFIFSALTYHRRKKRGVGI